MCMTWTDYRMMTIQKSEWVNPGLTPTMSYGDGISVKVSFERPKKREEILRFMQNLEVVVNKLEHTVFEYDAKMRLKQ